MAEYANSKDKLSTTDSHDTDDETGHKVIDSNKDNYNTASQGGVHLDNWQKLKQYTDARIALGRAGTSIPTKPLLNFQLDHAEAKDAVLQALDSSYLKQQLSKALSKHKTFQMIEVSSQASTKSDYLKRPDWGRLLNDESVNTLKSFGKNKSYDVVIVIGDGLSARAIEENAPKLVAELIVLFEEQGWEVAPLVIATGSRVALGDRVAEHLNAKMLVMLIGERPGLSSPDSLGIYYTWNATSSSNDSMRNCISNVRSAGLPIKVAASRLLALMIKSKQIQLSGVGIKDEQETPVLNQNKPTIQLL